MTPQMMGILQSVYSTLTISPKAYFKRTKFFFTCFLKDAPNATVSMSIMSNKTLCHYVLYKKSKYSSRISTSFNKFTHIYSKKKQSADTSQKAGTILVSVCVCVYVFFNPPSLKCWRKAHKTLKNRLLCLVITIDIPLFLAIMTNDCMRVLC